MKRLIPAALLSLSACLSPAPPDGFATKNLEATFLVAAPSPTIITCTAFFEDKATGSPVTLTDDDVVTCDGVVMQRSSYTYYTTLPYVRGKAYRVTLLRRGESPYVASVELPTSPAGIYPDNVLRQKYQQFAVYWNLAAEQGDSIEVAVYDSRTGPTRIQVVTLGPDTGSLILTAQQMTPATLQAGTTSGTLQVTRILNGEMPSGLAGSIEGRAVTQSTFTFID